MAPLRFRCWDPNVKLMAHDVTLEFLSKQTGLVMPHLNLALAHAAKSGLVLMQSTGLKDKNGVEIFESDYLRSVENDEVFEVSTLESWTRMCDYDCQENIGYYEDGKFVTRGSGGQYHSDDWISNPEFYEVIGNRYESPLT